MGLPTLTVVATAAVRDATDGPDFCAEVERETGMRIWATQLLDSGNETPLLDVAMPKLEKIFIEVALKKTNGRKKDAADLLGWGRNTLTRKLQELALD